MNTKLCIFPDKKYLDITNNEFRSLDAHVTTAANKVTFTATTLTAAETPNVIDTNTSSYTYSTAKYIKTYTALVWSNGSWSTTGETEKLLKDIAVNDLLIPGKSGDEYVINTKSVAAYAYSDNSDGVYFKVTAKNANTAAEYKWEKFNAIQNTTTTYSEGSSNANGSITVSSMTSAGLEYSFNSATGMYTVSDICSIAANSLSGKYVPGGYGSNVLDYYGAMTDLGDGSYRYTMIRKGSTSHTSYTYSKGSTSYGYVTAPEGKYPSNGTSYENGTYYWYTVVGATGTTTTNVSVTSSVIDASGSFGSLEYHFKKGDRVNISGCTSFAANNKDYLEVVGVSGNVLTFPADTFTAGSEAAAVTIERPVPDLKYICAKGNRLWGVKDQTIYASALGDPSNFNAIDFVSTDSYAAAVGTPGEFTGICAYGTRVLCWKENTLHSVYGDTPDDFGYYTYDFDGVQDGSYKSLQIVKETLYYKGRNGVYAYTGDTPTLISYCFGENRYSKAVAGEDGWSYYISMMDAAGNQHLFVYDTVRQVWMREDDMKALDFAYLDGLYALAGGTVYKLNTSQMRFVRCSYAANALAAGNYYITVDGTGYSFSIPATTGDIVFDTRTRSVISVAGTDYPVIRGEFGAELTFAQSEYFVVSPAVEWSARFCPFYEGTQEMKDYKWIRLRHDGTVRVRVSDDSSEWTQEYEGSGKANIPLAPMRCDKMEIELSGTGECKVGSMVREFHVGSETV